MDDPNGARQTDPLRHAECISFDDTKPFLDHTKSRIACHGESWPADSAGGEYISMEGEGMFLGHRPFHQYCFTLINCVPFTSTITQMHCHYHC